MFVVFVLFLGLVYFLFLYVKRKRNKIQKNQNPKKLEKEKDQKYFCGSLGFRDPKSSNVVRSEPDSDLKPELEPKAELELQEIVEERSLSDTFSPPRTALPSCFNLPDLGPNVTSELRPYCTQMPLKFMGLEDACLFFRDLKQYVPWYISRICLLMLCK